MSEFIKNTFLMVGPLASRSGYGDHMRDVSKSVLKYKSDEFDYKFINVGWGSCPNTELKQDIHGDLISRMLQSSLDKIPEVYMQMDIPTGFNPRGKYNIGFTAGIETNICRAEWLEHINKMNLLLVPSKHSKDVFLKTKATKKHKNGLEESLECKVPIEILFEGVDTNIYKKTTNILDSLNILNSIEEDFSFLFVGHWIQGDIGHDRKDIGMLIKIFFETFKNVKNKPALILKTSGATLSIIDKHDILKKINDVRKTVNSSNLPNVYLIHGILTPDEMNCLYNHPKVKAHINISHGEGFCRPLLEASLSEKPIIASNWSGHLDFLNPEYANLIDGDLKQVHPSSVNEWIIKESSWFYCNYSKVAQTMENVYKNYNKFLEKAKFLTKENCSKFSLKKMDEKFYQILDKYIPEFEKEVKIKLPKLKLEDDGDKLPSLRKS